MTEKSKEIPKYVYDQKIKDGKRISAVRREEVHKNWRVADKNKKYDKIVIVRK